MRNGGTTDGDDRGVLGPVADWPAAVATLAEQCVVGCVDDRPSFDEIHGRLSGHGLSNFRMLSTYFVSGLV